MQRQLRLKCGDPPWTLGDVVCGCFELSRKGTRVTSGVRDIARTVVTTVSNAMMMMVESTACERWWRTFDFCDSPLLQSKGGKSRRLSIGMKRAFVIAAAEASGVHTATQIIAVQNCLKRRRIAHGGVACGGEVPENTGFERDFMLQYWVEGVKEFSRCKHLSVSLDGARVSGEEVLYFAAYSPDLRLSVWLPPQAFSEVSEIR
jgi:hypothetical protein